MKKLLTITIILLITSTIVEAQLNSKYTRFIKKHKISSASETFVSGKDKLSYVHSILSKDYKSIIFGVNKRGVIISVSYFFPSSKQYFLFNYCRKNGYVSEEYVTGDGTSWYTTIDNKVLFRYYDVHHINNKEGNEEPDQKICIEFHSLDEYVKFDTGLN